MRKEYQKRFDLIDLDKIEVEDKFNIFPLFCALTLKKNEDNNLFLEIGGGNKPIFLHILKSVNKKYKFQVLEEKNFKIKIPQEYKNYLNYVYRLEDINFKVIKAVLFSGSIQYIENYKAILEEVFKNNIEYIFITETNFTDGPEDIFTLQNNMGNTKFPTIFISYKKLDKFFKINSYELIFQTKRKVGKYSHNKLDKDHYFVKDLVYKIKV